MDSQTATKEPRASAKLTCESSAHRKFQRLTKLKQGHPSPLAAGFSGLSWQTLGLAGPASITLKAHCSVLPFLHCLLASGASFLDSLGRLLTASLWAPYLKNFIGNSCGGGNFQPSFVLASLHFPSSFLPPSLIHCSAHPYW